MLYQSRISLFCLFAVTLLASAALAQSSDYDWHTWGTVTDTLVCGDVQQRLTLSSAFIVEGSEKVYLDSVLVSPDRYEINYQRGLLRLTDPPAAGSVVTVSYLRQPVMLNSVYSLRQIEFADPQETIPHRSTPMEQRERLINPAGDLVFGGMKSVSFSIGTNRGSSIDQSLQATVEGHLTSSITVRALLSDNNLPVQPQGNTEELEYLDKVFVEFAGPNAKATLGDFSYLSGSSTFSSFRRELKGISGQVQGFDSQVGLAGGSSKGVFRSVEFRGTEQMQGPYDLLSGGRVTGEVIIAGTERVYFDGDIVDRGRNRDYTIDYDAGTLTFTPRRIVTADTKIGVEFEVTQQRYDRTSTFGNVQTKRLPADFRFEASAAIERDDPGRPKTITLNEEDQEVLAAAGDDPDRAVSGGVTLVGVGNGDYLLIPADPLNGVPEHFAFDDTAGTYIVSFTNVHAGEGDYKLSGITSKGLPIYSYAGEGKGNYTVGKRLPTPQSHSVVTTRLVREDGDHFGVDFEYNMSEFDQNTLSPIGDLNNVGDAGRLTLGLKRLPVLLGEFDITESLSTVQQDFKSLGQTRPWYFYTDWNLEGIPIEGREILQQLAASYRPTEGSRLEYDFGTIRRDNFEGTKHEARTALTIKPDRTIDGRLFETDVRGLDQRRTRNHATASGSYGFWALVPSVSYSSDEFLVASTIMPDSGFAYDLVTVGVAKRNVSKFGYQFQVSERNTRQLASATSAWLNTRRDRTYRVSLAAHGTGPVDGTLEYSHRVQNEWLTGDVRRSDLARITGLIRFDGLGLRNSVDYELSQDAFRALEKTVVYVGTGKGDYNEIGEPVGEGKGDYALVFLPSLETVPTRNVGLTLRTSWKPPGTPGSGIVSWIQNNVSLEQQLTVREATTYAEGYKVYLLFPSALQRNESTMYGIVSLHQDWSLLNGHPKTSLNVRYQRDDEEDNRFAPVKEDKFFEQQVVTLDRSVSRVLSTNVEATRERRKRGGVGLLRGTGSTYDVTGYSVAGGWSLRLTPSSTLDGQLIYGWRDDTESGAEERTISFRPRFVCRIRKSLNLFGRYELVHPLGDGLTGVYPFFFTARGSAHRWSTTLNIKWTKIISFLTTYQGRSEETFSGKRIVEHDFKVETRAYF